MTQTPSSRLEQLGIALPPVVTPLAAYTPATSVGSQVWTSGQLPMVDGALAATGKLGGQISLEQGADLARQAALNAIAAAAGLAGGIDRITRVLKVVVYVASEASFTDQPKVANGASVLLGEVFGDAGVHVRSAVGVSVLPLDSPIEVELVVETA
ncbi:RidA family protein [Aestuariimicrobium ganziense]|uniref:RidA family protein n=1 Tax=Aestuariimicrobium ganziense TaxID=2773677 RepID=UPI0019424E81|nr:RidA family protein [Aestuariimicrobium ganziense]